MVVVAVDLVAGGGVGRNDVHVADLAGPCLLVTLVRALTGDFQLKPVAGGDDHGCGIDLNDVFADFPRGDGDGNRVVVDGTADTALFRIQRVRRAQRAVADQRHTRAVGQDVAELDQEICVLCVDRGPQMQLDRAGDLTRHREAGGLVDQTVDLSGDGRRHVRETIGRQIAVRLAVPAQAAE